MPWRGKTQPNPKKDEIGKRYGKLVVVTCAGKDKHGNYLWTCKCDCGGEITTRGGTLRKCKAASCGCVAIEKARLSRQKSRISPEEIQRRLTEPRPCRKCGKIKPPDYFAGPTKHQCLDCRTQYHYELMQKKGGGKRVQMKLRYGITPEQYDQMIVDQNYQCAICRDNLDLGHRTNVDHCHISLVVRGITCDSCNKMLGYARDRIDVLESAIDYLKKFQEKHKVLLDNTPSMCVVV